MGQPVMQWQILAREPDKLAAFYTKLFDWKIHTNNALNYRTVDTGSKRGIGGGIWPAPPEGHSMVSLYVEVEDVAKFVGKAQSIGGKVIIPPQKLPDGDEMAVILDPEGIPVGLFKSGKPR
jgi:predicted enzyme related to lactoylglutathione lyase